MFKPFKLLFNATCWFVASARRWNLPDGSNAFRFWRLNFLETFGGSSHPVHVAEVGLALSCPAWPEPEPDGARLQSTWHAAANFKAQACLHLQQATDLLPEAGVAVSQRVAPVHVAWESAGAWLPASTMRTIRTPWSSARMDQRPQQRRDAQWTAQNLSCPAPTRTQTSSES